MPILTGTIDDVTGSPLPDRVPLATLRVTVRAPSRRSSLTEQARLVASVPVPVEVSPTGEISVELEPGPAVMLVEGEGLRDVYELGVTADMTLLTEALQEMSPTRSWVESQMVQLRSQTVTAAADALDAAIATGQDRAEIELLRQNLIDAANENAAPHLTEAALNATYGTKAEVQAAADAAASLDADKLDKTEAAATFLERADFVPSLGSDWVALGDSLTSPEGGAPPGAGWVDYVRFRTGGRFYLLKNAGVPGNNTAQMLARLQADVLAHNPRVVTFLGGTNDITQGVTLATYQSNVTQIVDQLTTAGIAVIILSIPPRDLTDKKLPETVRFNAWLKEFARTRRLHFVDVHSRMVDPATGGFKAGLGRDDLLHLSRTGAAAIGDAVIEAMTPFMPTGGGYRPAFNADPNNLVNNGLLLSGTDATPTGFTYNALPAGVTRGRVDDSSFQGGKAWQVTVTAPAATVTSSFETSVRAEWSPGDRLLFTVRFEIEGTPSLPHNPPDSNFGITFASLFYGAPSGAVQYLARYQSLAGHYGLAHAVTQVPAGTTGPVQIAANVVMPAGSSGTFRVGEFGCYNLTTMGVVA